jgi:hypothetical protein
LPTTVGKDATLRGPREVTLLDKEWLVHLLEGLGILRDSHREGADTDGSTAVLLGQSAQQPMIHLVETMAINLEQLESGRDGSGVGYTVGALKGEIAREAEKVVGDARSTAAARGDGLGPALA